MIKSLSSALLKTKNNFFSLSTVVLLSLGASSCSDRIHVIPEPEQSGVPVKVNVVSLEQEPFGPLGTKAGNLAAACSKISYCVLNASGNEIYRKLVHQSKDKDESFGTLSFKLEEGEYKLVVIAHSCATNPKLDSPDKLEIPTNKNGLRVTDTFLYNSKLTVSKGMQPINISLNRVVAGFELRLTGTPVPDDVDYVEFEFGTNVGFNLNPKTGLSVKSNSKYTEKVAVLPGDTVVCANVFVSEDPTSADVTVTAYDKSGGVFRKTVVQDAPFTKNKKTICRGDLFAAEVFSLSSVVSVDQEWNGTDVIEFSAD